MLDKLSQTTCPRDGSHLLPVVDGGIGTDACGQCGGLWVPEVKLTPQLSEKYARRLFYEIHGRDTSLRCPVDGQAMRELTLDGVQIDRCDCCRGLWFDAGELTAVLQATGAAATYHGDSKTADCLDSIEILPDAVGSGVDVIEIVCDGAGNVVEFIGEFIGGVFSL